jgi:GH15 family glucan-1,4-alpha-glucosidase
LSPGGTALFDADPAFRPVRRRDDHLALEDMALVGDGTTAALVGLDGSVPWLCVSRFDSQPLFCGLLDAARGGGFTVAPEEVLEEESWRVVTPVLEGWARGVRPLEEYDAGSDGP